MRTIINVLLGLLILTSCNQKSNLKKEDVHESKNILNLIDTPIDTSLIINDLRKEDFKIIRSSDTTFYLKQLYEGIDGKSIQYDKNSFNSISARIKFNFSFLQYTIDDSPAYPISYSKQSPWAKLTPVDGSIEIPGFYGSVNSNKLYERLNHLNFKSFMEEFYQDFEIIKRESIRKQTEFYTKLLQNKLEYKKCCPEYIIQAENFIKRKNSDYTSIDELGLELFYKSIMIEITGSLIDGRSFKRILVEKQK